MHIRVVKQQKRFKALYTKGHVGADGRVAHFCAARLDHLCSASGQEFLGVRAHLVVPVGGDDDGAPRLGQDIEKVLADLIGIDTEC